MGELTFYDTYQRLKVAVAVSLVALAGWGITSYRNYSTIKNLESEAKIVNIATGNYTGNNFQSNDIAIARANGNVEVWMYEPECEFSNPTKPNESSVLVRVKKDAWGKYNPKNSEQYDLITSRAKDKLGVK